jgi:hypothetical protein
MNSGRAGRSRDAGRAILTVMQKPSAPTGVCIVRIEPRGRGLRLTVITNPDICQRSTEQTRSFTEVAEALAAMEKFVTGCAGRATND